MVGQQILHYLVLEKLGEGGMGTVFLARDSRLDRDVALKFISDATDDPTVRERFVREARAASRLSHPNIVGIHYIESTDQGDFIVMEYVEGRSLGDLMASGNVPSETVMSLAREIAGGLAAAHDAGIVHRDIKPDNILVSENGHAKILDFGIAHLAGADPLTRTQATVGTLAYMSPEQARGDDIDARSDLFSFGAVLYELATGQSPFRGEYAAATMFKILNEDPVPVSTLRPDLPDALDRVVSRCLEKERDNRFASAAEILRQLAGSNEDGAPSEQQVTDQAVSTSLARVSGNARRRGVAAAAAVALIVVAAVLYFMGQSARVDDQSIAVMRFVNSTGDEDVDFLCSGIPESLIHRLSPIPGLKVISRASSFALQEHADDPAEVGKRLDVRTVLLGRLERRGDDLSISAELVDTGENRQLWGQKYRRPSTQVFALEEEIARSIAETLRGRLTAGVRQVVQQDPTKNPEAYELFLKGNYVLDSPRGTLSEAVDYFRRATELDPEFSLAWSGMAQVLAIQAYLTIGTRDELLVDAKTAMENALRLTPLSSEAHNAAGMIKFYFDWDWDGAERSYLRAIELNAGNARAYNRYSTFLISMGRDDDGLKVARRAEELDPISTGPTHDLGIVHLIRGEYNRAARQFDKAMELHPEWIWGYVKGSLSEALAGNSERALELAATVQDKTDGWGSAGVQAWTGAAYVFAGRRDLALEVLNRMHDREDSEYVDPTAF
ncbi:MAG: protein kinase, partial [Rhodothermales bacterium]|nr:protein kinase [Rhodothermales bacterium]